MIASFLSDENVTNLLASQIIEKNKDSSEQKKQKKDFTTFYKVTKIAEWIKLGESITALEIYQLLGSKQST